MLLDGKPLPAEPGPDRGIVFQRYSVFPHLSVLGNVLLGLELAASPVLGRLFGSARRRAIAQAVVKQPRILLLDEPFGALDPGIRADMHELIHALWRENKMMVFMVSTTSKKHSNSVLVFSLDKVRHDPQAPEAYGATITYDIPLAKKTDAHLANVQTAHERTRHSIGQIAITAA